MPQKPTKSNGQCLYWCNSSKKCKLSGTGLFIPQEDHTEIYCTTTSYPKCLQFVLHSQNQLEIVGKSSPSAKNRRRYMRVDAAYAVTIDKVIRPEEQVTRSAIEARTLDLSMGGIRLATLDPLESDAIVQLIFDSSFPESLHSATGQVSWCNKQIDEPGYQVGISFNNDKVKQAMGNFLN